MKVSLNPSGWAVSIEECPPGPFLWYYTEGKSWHLGFKSEYRMEANLHEPEVYNEAGEYMSSKDLEVWPCEVHIPA